MRLLLNRLKELGYSDDEKLQEKVRGRFALLGHAVLETPHLVEATLWAAQQLGTTYKSLCLTITRYLNGTDLQEPDTSQRGTGSITWVRDAVLYKEQLSEAIRNFIKQRLEEDGRTTTTPAIQDMLLREHKLAVSASAVRYCLANFLKLSFGKVVAIGLHDPTTPYAKWLFRRFVVQYNTALQEEKAKQAVVVYSDESYVNTGHHSQYGWFLPEWRFRAATGKGSRLIIIHALTKDGLLTTNGPDGKPLDVPFRDPSENIYTAELIFQAGVAEPKKNKDKKDKKKEQKQTKKEKDQKKEAASTGDYHNNMDSSGYARWLRTRLFPTFRKIYFKYNKHAKVTKAVGMRLVIDGAGYHTKRNDHWLLSGRTKPELLELLLELLLPGDRKIVVTRATGPVTLVLPVADVKGAAWLKKQSLSSPGLEELKAAIKAQLELPEHADKLKSELVLQFEKESLADTNSANPHFHKVIFTPPYESRTQPSEHLWAYAKNFVGASYCRGRGIPVLRQQVRQGFYGDGDKHTAVDAKFCAKIIQHAAKYINAWIEADDILGGALLTLTGGDRLPEMQEEEEAVEPREDDSLFDDVPDPAMLLGAAGDILLCTCQQPYNSARSMVECGECLGWYHPDCVDLDGEELTCVMEEEDTEWSCPQCVEQRKISAKRGREASDTAAAPGQPRKKRKTS